MQIVQRFDHERSSSDARTGWQGYISIDCGLFRQRVDCYALLVVCGQLAMYAVGSVVIPEYTWPDGVNKLHYRQGTL